MATTTAEAKTDVAGATEKLRAANAKKDNPYPRSFPKKRPVGRPRKDGAPAGSPPAEPPAGDAADAGGAPPRSKLPQLPEHLIPIAACAPLMLSARGLSLATKVPVEKIAPSPDAQVAVVEAFKVWFKTLPIDISPGYALLAAYGVALLDMSLMTMAQADEAKKAAAAAAEKKPKKTTAPSGGAPAGGGTEAVAEATAGETTAGPVTPEHVNGASLDPAASA